MYIDMTDLDISIKCLEQNEEILALKNSWNELHRNCTSPSVYNGFDFVYEAIRTYERAKPGRKIFTLTDTTSGELIAIFPLQKVREKWFLFNINTYEYIVRNWADKPFPLIRKGYSRICWTALLQHLKGNNFNWDHLRLVEMPTSNEASDELPEICKKLDLIFRINPDAEGPVINLEGDWNEYWSQHRNMRKTNRKIEKDFSGRLKFTVHRDNWKWCLDQYIELEGKSWKKGTVGISESEETITFYNRFSEQIGDSGNLHFGFLTIDDELISAEIGYTLGDVVYFSHGCYDDSYKKYSPGAVSISYFIKHFYESSYKEGDYLTGYAGYLKSWCDSLICTNVIEIYNKNVKMRAMFAIRLVRKILYNPAREFLAKLFAKLDKGKST